MKGFGAHASIWTMHWTRENAENAVREASRMGFDLLEIPLGDFRQIDGKHSRELFEKAEIEPVCSFCLPDTHRASVDPDKAAECLMAAIDKAAEIGATAVSGVTYGSLGERSGRPPTQKEMDNVAVALGNAARYARERNVMVGIEPINRYESHLINTARQAVVLIERIGQPNLFVHLDTFHMNIEERGVGNGIVEAGDHLKYMHLSESDRGLPGTGTMAWDEIFTGLAAIRYQGGLALESFANMPPHLAAQLAIWRPPANSPEEVLRDGVPFLRNKARQYGLL